MTEIPEHLRKRAEEARAKAAAASGGAEAPAGGGDAAPPSEAESKIPAHLLERSKAAKAKAAGGDAPRPPRSPPRRRRGHRGRRRRAAARHRPRRPHPAPAHGGEVGLDPGRQGHSRRTRSTCGPTCWSSSSSPPWRAPPSCSIFSVFVNAPLLELANVNQTPNPSKAPWYFLGLQELLKWFHPMVAGVMLPGMGLVGLILAPYTDRNPSNKPENRKFAISLFTMFLMYWAVLVMIGTFFRGPGFNFIFPWNDGLFVEL